MGHLFYQTAFLYLPLPVYFTLLPNPLLLQQQQLVRSGFRLTPFSLTAVIPSFNLLVCSPLPLFLIVFLVLPIAV